MQSEERMIRLSYVSSAAAPMTNPQIIDLLAQARRNNERDGITGLLLYHDGNFMQVVEGETAMVRALVGRLQRDSRHRGIIKVFEEDAHERQFQNWGMGFQSIAALTDSQRAAIPQDALMPLTASYAGQPTLARKLLTHFARVSLRDPG